MKNLMTCSIQSVCKCCIKFEKDELFHVISFDFIVYQFVSGTVERTVCQYRPTVYLMYNTILHIIYDTEIVFLCHVDYIVNIHKFDLRHCRLFEVAISFSLSPKNDKLYIINAIDIATSPVCVSENCQ